MVFNTIYSIKDVVNTSYEFFESILKNELLIYLDSLNCLKIVDLKSFLLLKEVVLDNTYRVHSTCENIYLIKDNNTLFDLSDLTFELRKIYQSTTIPDYQSSIGLFNDGILLENYSKYENYNCVDRIDFIYSFPSKQIIYQSINGPYFIYIEDYFLYFQSESLLDLTKLTIDGYQELWNYKFPFRSFGKRIIYNSEYYLIAQGGQLNANSQNSLIRINKSDGKLEWKKENTFSFYNYDELNNKLYGLGGNTFEAINVTTGIREVQKHISDKLHISSHLTYYAEGFLYFSGYRDNHIPVFGAVDVKTGELVFTQTVEMPGEKSFRKGLDRPVVVGNRLYVRDAMKTLHIFERESNPV